jgi:7-keto-8-aminopelargonate synthetase-like enzyme
VPLCGAGSTSESGNRQVGSARLHLSHEFPALQAQLKLRLDVCAKALQGAKLKLTTLQSSPIFQAQCDSPRIAFSVADLMKARGFYACVCVFPAVPMKSPRDSLHDHATQRSRRHPCVRGSAR